MSSSKKIDACHRCLTAKCNGRMEDSKKLYGRYAYWCGKQHLKGWRAEPCEHIEEKKR